MNIVYVHAIMDYEPDKEVGKSTIAVSLKSKNLMLAVLLLILILSYASIIGGVIFGYLAAWYLLTLITLPMACALFYLMLEFVRHPEKKYTPKKWMAPMPNWENYQKAGLDWFMIRWLLARNLLSLFCLLIIIACFIS
jgi:1,4-dihydroxy-2-naphthoate octaprenyltransferase